jgi:hypothetical protein
MYLGAPDGNSMNTFASEAMFRSLLTATGEATPKAALDRIQDFAGEVIAALNAWAAAVQIVAVKKMLGTKHRYEECEIAHHEFLPQDQICFPFFMSVPERHREQLK